MRSIAGTLNSVELVGWLGNDAEAKAIGSKSKLVTFNVATKRRTGSKALGYNYESEWMTVEAWDTIAERAKQFTKGTRVLVRGSFMTQSWEDKTTGKKQYRTVVRAADCFALTPSESADHDDDSGEE